jgi:hypothetical protein
MEHQEDIPQNEKIKGIVQCRIELFIITRELSLHKLNEITVLLLCAAQELQTMEEDEKLIGALIFLIRDKGKTLWSLTTSADFQAVTTAEYGELDTRFQRIRDTIIHSVNDLSKLYRKYRPFMRFLTE